MIPVLLGLGAIVGGILVVANWEEIEGWLKEFLPKLQATLKEVGIADYAAKLFSTIEGNVMRLIHKLYYKENGKWVEKTTVKDSKYMNDKLISSPIPEYDKNYALNNSERHLIKYIYTTYSEI